MIISCRDKFGSSFNIHQSKIQSKYREEIDLDQTYNTQKFLSRMASMCLAGKRATNGFYGSNQGSSTETEGSVQLTSFLYRHCQMPWL